MIRNNQNRRRRGGGSGSGSGPRPQQMAGGNNYGNRLDNRQRGNASQLLEKYRGLARDAQQAGDRVTAEYYLQYAEHYYRMLGDYRDRPPADNRQRRDFYDDDALNAEAETDAGDADDDNDADGADVRDDRPAERNGNGNGNGRWQDGERREARNPRRDERPRDERPRDERPRDERPRDERPRDERPRDERPRDERPRDERRREWRERRPERSEPRSDARVDEAPVEAGIPGLPGPATLRTRPQPAETGSDSPADDARPMIVAPIVAPVVVGDAASGDAAPAELASETPAPRRRGRPRKVVADTEG